MPENPVLFAGFNADPINGDEADGAGTNWQVWPVLFDSYDGLEPLIITQEMLAAFDECADLILPAADNVITFPFENNEITIGGNWPDVVIDPAGVHYTIRKAS